MSERYSKLFALPPNLYSEGAPVLISAGALLKDNQTGKVLAQLKIHNISDKPIKAATVKLTPADTTGKLLGDEVQHQYLDLNAGRDADFGQKIPVSLPDTSARGFSAAVSEVIFSDNTTWTGSNTPWKPLSSPAPLDNIGDTELVKQYCIKYGVDCRYIFKQEKDLWHCACGAVNHQNETACHRCHKEAAILAAVDIEALKTERDKRLAQEKKAAAAQAKKAKKIAMIAVPVVVVAIVAGMLIIPNAAKQKAYSEAVALMNEQNYTNAVYAFSELGDYKDSEELTAAALKSALGFPSGGESSLDIFYDAAQELFTVEIYMGSQGFSKEEYIQRYGEESLDELAFLLPSMWEDMEYEFDELGLDISFQVCIYASPNRTTLLASYPE